MTDYIYDSAGIAYDDPDVAYDQRVTGGRTSGSVVWSGAVSGRTDYLGFAAGIAAWAGATSGTAAYTGSAAGTAFWSGKAAGVARHSGVASGTVVWTGLAVGPRAVQVTATGWRYHAQKLPSGEWISHELPISGVTMHHDLSGPSALTGTIARGFAGEVAEGVLPWGTAIYPEASGQLRGGFIVTDADPTPDALHITCVGFAGYPTGIPFDGDYVSSNDGLDAFEAVRLIWSHVQGKPGGDLGVIVDSEDSWVLLGNLDEWLRLHPGKTAGDFEDSDRYTLRWWNNTDCGSELDQLASQTPFDYAEYHTWSGNNVAHGITLGYPRLGRRRHDLRFVLGENLASVPQPTASGDYASEVVALSAGQGSKMLRSVVARPTDRLRRVSTLAEKDVRSRRRLAADAQRLLDRNSHAEQLTDIDVFEHPNAALADLRPGDEIPVTADLGWREMNVWGRITSVSYTPEKGMATLSLEQL